MADKQETAEEKIARLEAGWCGPCAHGCDPYTRCDDCSDLPLPQLVLKSVNHWSHAARQLERERDAFRAELEKTQADLRRVTEERNSARESRRAMEFELKLLRDGQPAAAAAVASEVSP